MAWVRFKLYLQDFRSKSTKSTDKLKKPTQLIQIISLQEEKTLNPKLKTMTSLETLETHIPQKMTKADTWRLIAVCSAYFIVKGIWMLSWYTYISIPLPITSLLVVVLDTYVIYLYRRPYSEPKKFFKIYLTTMTVVSLLCIAYYTTTESSYLSFGVYSFAKKILGILAFLVLPIALSATLALIFCLIIFLF